MADLMADPHTSGAANAGSDPDTGLIARSAIALTAWTERYVPDAFIFALIGTLIVIVAGVTATPSSLVQVIDAWGAGFWELIPFTLQMSLVIITGHVLATSRADRPPHPRGRDAGPRRREARSRW